jgi:hypothetical protein
MELEFDKEIDAILRKARGGGSLAVAAVRSPHLDADSVAAFAENALPQKAKLLYIEHFADCDRCRRMLSQSMLLNSEADRVTASPVLAPAAQPVIPWYQKLFKTQNLALAMGALVLTFGGILGVVVLQNRQAAVNMSQENETAPKPSGPSFNEESATAAANVAVVQTANTNSATALATPANTSAAANAQMAVSEPSANKPVMLGGVRADADSGAGASPDSGLIAMAKERPKDQPSSLAAPPPPPPAKSAVMDAVPAEPRKADDERKLKSETERQEMDHSVARKRSEVTRGRDLPPAASKSGPARSGPLNTQSNQVQNQIEMPVTRIVSGKTFNNRNGVWYDSAYRNQATINHRRGTNEYKSLDAGLRAIANTVGGTVVIVWKEKAYRIQ